MGGVLVALIALGFVLGTTIVRRQEADKPKAQDAMLPEVSQRIRDFRRVKVRDGRKVWELTAREAEYLEDQGQVVVKDPVVLFYVENGDSVHVAGHEGRIFVRGNNLDRIELGGGIEVKMKDYVVRTAQAIYDHEHDTIVSPGRVEVQGTSLSLDGETMVVELKSQRVQILKSITSTFRGGADLPTGALELGAAHESSARTGEGAGAAPR